MRIVRLGIILSFMKNITTLKWFTTKKNHHKLFNINFLEQTIKTLTIS